METPQTDDINIVQNFFTNRYDFYWKKPSDAQIREMIRQLERSLELENSEKQENEIDETIPQIHLLLSKMYEEIGDNYNALNHLNISKDYGLPYAKTDHYIAQLQERLSLKQTPDSIKFFINQIYSGNSSIIKNPKELAESLTPQICYILFTEFSKIPKETFKSLGIQEKHLRDIIKNLRQAGIEQEHSGVLAYNYYRDKMDKGEHPIEDVEFLETILKSLSSKCSLQHYYSRLALNHLLDGKNLIQSDKLDSANYNDTIYKHYIKINNNESLIKAAQIQIFRDGWENEKFLPKEDAISMLIQSYDSLDPKSKDETVLMFLSQREKMEKKFPQMKTKLEKHPLNLVSPEVEKPLSREDQQLVDDYFNNEKNQDFLKEHPFLFVDYAKILEPEQAVDKYLSALKAGYTNAVYDLIDSNIEFEESTDTFLFSLDDYIKYIQNAIDYATDQCERLKYQALMAIVDRKREIEYKKKQSTPIQQSETVQSEIPQPETPRPETPRSETPRSETPQLKMQQHEIVSHESTVKFEPQKPLTSKKKVKTSTWSRLYLDSLEKHERELKNVLLAKKRELRGEAKEKFRRQKSALQSEIYKEKNRSAHNSSVSEKTKIIKQQMIEFGQPSISGQRNSNQMTEKFTQPKGAQPKNPQSTQFGFPRKTSKKEQKPGVVQTRENILKQTRKNNKIQTGFYKNDWQL